MSKFELLKEYIIRDIIEYYSSDDGLDIKEAMSRFYSSEVFEKLDDVHTGLYLCGSGYIYEIFRDELEDGRIVQKEI
jgi:hypothetical protein